MGGILEDPTHKYVQAFLLGFGLLQINDHFKLLHWNAIQFLKIYYYGDPNFISWMTKPPTGGQTPR